MNALAGSLALLLPYPFHCKTAELDCFGGPSCGGSDGLLGRWRMPHIGKDGDAFEQN